MLKKINFCIIIALLLLFTVSGEDYQNGSIYKYLESSNFHDEPYGVMSAFDEDKANYAAAIKNDFPNWFIVSVDKPVLVENIQIEWLNKIDYATDFEIYGMVENKWILLAKETDFKIGLNTVLYKKNLKEPLLINRIKMVVNKTHGQQRLLMRKFELNTEFSGKSYESVNQVVSEILSSGYRDISPHQKIVLFMDWMDDNIRPELGSSDAIEAINQKVGACGTLSQLLIAMANEVGLEARPINLYNYPKAGLGHSLVEVKWGNEWHLYDPTYQAYYLANADDINNHIDPDVASFDEIKSDPSLVDRNRVVLNVKRLYRGFLIKDENGSEMIDASGIYTSSNAYRKASPAGPIGPDIPMVFPAAFDLEQGFYQYGKKDFQYKEMKDIHKVPQGLYMLGVSYHNVNQNYIVKNIIEGELYELELGIVDSSPDLFELSVKGKGVKIINSSNIIISSKKRTETEVLKIPFIAEEETGYIYLEQNYNKTNYILLDYIRISKTK